MKNEKLKVYDAFETKSQAEKQAKQLKEEVQFVKVKKMTGRLKWGVFLGGKGSSIYV